MIDSTMSFGDISPYGARSTVLFESHLWCLPMLACYHWSKNIRNTLSGHLMSLIAPCRRKSWCWMVMDVREAVLFQISGSDREPNLNSILYSALCARSLFFSLGPGQKLMTGQSIEARCSVITSESVYFTARHRIPEQQAYVDIDTPI